MLYIRTVEREDWWTPSLD